MSTRIIFLLLRALVVVPVLSLVGMILLGRLRPIRVLIISAFLDEHHLLGDKRLVISMMMDRLHNV